MKKPILENSSLQAVKNQIGATDTLFCALGLTLSIAKKSFEKYSKLWPPRDFEMTPWCDQNPLSFHEILSLSSVWQFVLRTPFDLAWWALWWKHSFAWAMLVVALATWQRRSHLGPILTFLTFFLIKNWKSKIWKTGLVSYLSFYQQTKNLLFS